ncbi:MAG: OmpH family outer membrane protein [Magnetococcales bacterium]|nr:OmpH family outer membrane protein [Magnetococcales bacterium]
MFFVLAGLITGSSSALAQSKGTFAYVDVPRAIASSVAGEKARDLLKNNIASKQKEIADMEAEIKRMKENTDKKKSLMKPEALSEMRNTIQRKFREYQRMVEDNQAALDRENRRWTKKITKTLHEIIQEIGREKNYTAIFSRGQVLYADPSINITDEVLKRLNSRTKDWF